MQVVGHQGAIGDGFADGGRGATGAEQAQQAVGGAGGEFEHGGLDAVGPQPGEQAGQAGGGKVLDMLQGKLAEGFEGGLGEALQGRNFDQDQGAGLEVRSYPYYDPATGGLRFEALCEALAALPPQTVVLLHACCHNPTGVDLTPAQWDALVPVLKARGLIAFLDHSARERFVRQEQRDMLVVESDPARLLDRSGIGGWFVQLGAYGDRSRADSLAGAVGGGRGALRAPRGS